MFKLIDKKIITILHSKFCSSRPAYGFEMYKDIQCENITPNRITNKCVYKNGLIKLRDQYVVKQEKKGTHFPACINFVRFSTFSW